MNFIVSFRLALVAVVLVPFLSMNAEAFIRAPMWDDDLVDQSDLILIAHLKENQFEIMKDPQDPEFDRKVFFTTIVVSQVLKGSASLGDLRVGLHDPNYPMVLGGPFSIVPPQAGEHPDASAAIGVAAIVGTIFTTTTDDIRHDQIWFLRTYAPPQFHTDAIAGPPGLWFPEGIQPVKLVPYFQAIMKGDANAVAAYDDEKSDWWSRRVQFASERIAAKQALLEHDPSARCDELLEIYTTDGPFSPAGILALKEIMDCGKLGASKLVPLFVKADDHAFDRSRYFKRGRAQATRKRLPSFSPGSAERKTGGTGTMGLPTANSPPAKARKAVILIMTLDPFPFAISIAPSWRWILFIVPTPLMSFSRSRPTGLPLAHISRGMTRSRPVTLRYRT